MSGVAMGVDSLEVRSLKPLFVWPFVELACVIWQPARIRFHLVKVTQAMEVAHPIIQVQRS